MGLADALLFDVARFGASTDGSSDSTAALQAAIDAAAKVALCQLRAQPAVPAAARGADRSGRHCRLARGRAAQRNGARNRRPAAQRARRRRFEELAHAAGAADVRPRPRRREAAAVCGAGARGGRARRGDPRARRDRRPRAVVVGAEEVAAPRPAAPRRVLQLLRRRGERRRAARLGVLDAAPGVLSTRSRAPHDDPRACTRRTPTASTPTRAATSSSSTTTSRAATIGWRSRRASTRPRAPRSRAL